MDGYRLSTYMYKDRGEKLKMGPIWDLNIGYDKRLNNLTLSPFIGVNNLFNTEYNDNIRINAFGSRFYEPAPKFNIYGGMRLRLNI